MDVVDSLDGAKLAIDRPWVRLLAGLREFGSECEQLAPLISQLLQVGEQYVLQIIVGAGTGMRDGHSVRPVEQWRPQVVQGRGSRTCGRWQWREPSRDLWQCDNDGVVLKRV